MHFEFLACLFYFETYFFFIFCILKESAYVDS